jgi:multidrug efflux pump subunit AcrA (membrane-fusion protein)
MVVMMLTGVVATAMLAWTEYRRPAPTRARVVAVDHGPVDGNLVARNSTLESCHIESLYGVAGAGVASVPLAGSRVRAGEIIVRLSDPKRESAKAAAALALASARRDVREACDARDSQRRPPRRLDPLVRERVAEAAGGVRRRSAPLPDRADACAAARAGASRASRALDEANSRLLALDLAAPIAGIISEVHVAPGAIVPDGPMLRIADDHCLLARAVYPRQVAPSIADGATACVLPAAASAAPACIGEIVEIDASRSGSTIDVLVRVRAPGAGLQMGESVRVIVPAASDDALRISRDAVNGSAARPFVWKVDPDSRRVSRQMIEPGIVGPTHLQILSGATAGDEMAIADEGSLTEGEEIVPTNVARQ